jgi:hypothetical protein
VAAYPSGILDNRGGPCAYGFQCTDGHHQGGLLSLEETGGLDRQARRVGESEVLVEPTRERRCEMRVTVNQARDQSFSASVVDLGVGKRLENLVGGAYCYDLVALDDERDVVLNGIGVDDACMREDDRPARRPLSPEAALLEK